MSFPPVQLFDTHLAQEQAQQTNLTVYSYDLCGLMQLPWPTQNGVLLTPIELVELVEAEGIHWPCFCSRINNGPLSSRILVEGGACYAYCHYAPSRCSFFVSLNAIYQLTSFTHEYTTPLLSSFPYTRPLFQSFLLDTTRSPDNPGGPLSLRGYFGDFDAGTQQHIRRKIHIFETFTLHGRPGPLHWRLPQRSLSNAATQTKPETGEENAETQAGSEGSETDVDEAAEDPVNGLETIHANAVERDFMLRLFSGEGMTTADFGPVMHQCSSCKKVFLCRLCHGHVCVV
ncbi:hypothetical protein B0H16DRAFT_1883769 [Mycena metata]|uniref:Uncharacterized protein n=1 Tax=Mycena metata TaxID=1033252 RepID=A0AAD7JFC1_9AGAR|nr:hypothetical protein B0H16DRAFT_1883769 [Mycena metata]